MATPDWTHVLTGRKAWIGMALFGALLIGFQYYLIFSHEPAARGVATPALDLPLPDFQLTERSGKPLGLAGLKGHPWIANFIFTSCPGPCLNMTRAMKRVQDAVMPEFPQARFVSFSVDPETDTPEVLAKYADAHGADPDAWFFLTGPDAVIQSLCLKGFNLALAEAGEDERPTVGRFIHSTKFVVVDADGHIRAYVDGLDPDASEMVKAHLRALKQP